MAPTAAERREATQAEARTGDNDQAEAQSPAESAPTGDAPADEALVGTTTETAEAETPTKFVTMNHTVGTWDEGTTVEIDAATADMLIENGHAKKPAPPAAPEAAAANG